MHIEHFGSEEVEDINIGRCFYFPKLDGTNCQVFDDNGKISAGSRNRPISLDDDHMDFMKYVVQHEGLLEYTRKYPNRRLFGEFLKPHTLKSYSDNAWNKFYVFDIRIEDNDYLEYMSYDSYYNELKEYGIEFIPPILEARMLGNEDIIKILEKNTFLIKDGQGIGEGLVLKNYEWKNKFGRVVWAKVVRNDFRFANTIEMGHPVLLAKKRAETHIIESLCSSHLVDKCYNKILEQGSWEKSKIPFLFHMVYRDLVVEEICDYVLNETPVIDYKFLKALCVSKIKDLKKELFV